MKSESRIAVSEEGMLFIALQDIDTRVNAIRP